MTQPIRVSVEDRHWEGFEPSDAYRSHDDNPVSAAVMDALRASPHFADRLPETAAVDLLASEGGDEWTLALFCHMGPPWDGYARLRVWFVSEPEDVAAIWEVVLEDTPARAFSFFLDMD
ncbi:MAG: hypothetical protein OXF27_08240 [Acidobacteria bacterium]|nr:hypothetical protein [Acidobacteriota bacterium]